MAFKLADLFIQFTTKGVEAVQDALGQVNAGLSKVHQSVQAVGNLAQAAFSRAAVAITGLATAGVAASSTGQLLHFQMERLSRTVAGLFGPEINKAIELLARFTDWITNLSAAQKEHLAVLLEAVGAFALVARILNPVIGLITALFVGTESGRKAIAGLAGALKSAMQALQPALTAIMDAWGPVVETVVQTVVDVIKELAPLLKQIADLVALNVRMWAPFLGALVEFAGGVLKRVIPVLMKVMDFLTSIFDRIAKIIRKVQEFLGIADPKVRASASGEEKDNRNALIPRMGGFEGIEATWQRIAQASRAVGAAGKPVEERQLDELERIRRASEDQAQTIKQQKPALKPG